MHHLSQYEPSHCTINLCHWSQELLWTSTCSSLLLVVAYSTWWCHLFGTKVMWKMCELITFSTLVMHYDSVYYPFFIFLFPGFVYYVSCLHVGSLLTLCVGQFCHYLFISTNSERSYTNVFVGLCMSFFASLTALYRGWWIQSVEWAHRCWGKIDWFTLWLRVTYWGANRCSSWRKLQIQHLYNGQYSKERR